MLRNIEKKHDYSSIDEKEIRRKLKMMRKEELIESALKHEINKEKNKIRANNKRLEQQQQKK